MRNALSPSKWLLPGLFLCSAPLLCLGAGTDLAALVTALPAQTESEQLKKAVLRWALQESAWERSQGRSDEAGQLLSDVQGSLNQSLDKPGETPANIFPAIPDFDKNPVAQDAVQTAEKLIAEGVSTDPQALVNAPSGPGDYNNHLTPDALLLAETLCHPQSPLRGDPRIIPVMFHRFETIYRNVAPGSKNLANFGYSPNITEMYLVIKKAYPGLLLPSRQREWEASLLANSEAIMKLRADIFRTGKPGTAYPNADVKYISALAYASEIFPRPDFLETALAGEKLMSTAIYPDGGWAYIGEQNENYTYHGIDITETARLLALTGDPTAKANLAASRWYLPLSIEPPGVAEYSMSPSWKHYWNETKGGPAAMTICGLFDDAANQRVASFEKLHGDWILASFYRADVKPAPSPDNYFVYDRNIQGPRGRFGAFSFSGTARMMPHEDRGKSTYAGCMKLYAPGQVPAGSQAAYPLDGALDMAGSEVMTEPGKPGVELSREETTVATVGSSLAAITSHYRLAPYHGPAIDWTGDQAWLFTPQRLVGLVCLTSRHDQDDFGANGLIDFIAPLPAKNAAPPAFQFTGANTFLFGGLVAHVLATDYGRIEPVRLQDRVVRANLRLVDPQIKSSGTNDLVHHTTGQSHFYLAEIFPDTAQAAKAITRLPVPAGSGLIGFEMDDGAHHYRLVFNPSTRDETYRSTLAWGSGKIWVHRSGEEYRPAWICDDGKASLTQPPTLLPADSGNVQLTIPAGTHVVFSDLE
jgi:hypothetical protein